VLVVNAWKVYLCNTAPQVCPGLSNCEVLPVLHDSVLGNNVRDSLILMM